MTTKTIDPAILYRIITYIGDENFEEVERSISSDQYGGDTHFQLIIKEKSTGKLYKINYSDWEIDHIEYDDDKGIMNGCDLGVIVEVKAVEKIIITYEPV